MTRLALMAVLAVIVALVAIGIAILLYRWLTRTQPAEPSPPASLPHPEEADARLVQDWLRAQVFEHTGQETSAPAMQTLLWQAAQQAVRELQTQPETQVVIPEITDGADAFQARLSAALLAELKRYANPPVDAGPNG